MLKLYELTQAGLAIQQAMEASENPDEWTVSLDQINQEIQEKVIGCGMVYRTLQAEAEVYEAEAERLSKRATSLKKQAEYLRIYVESNFLQLGLNEIKADTFKVKWRKLPDMVEIVDEQLIPSSHVRIIPQRIEPDKISIKEALQHGETVPGTCLITDRRKIEIK